MFLTKDELFKLINNNKYFLAEKKIGKITNIEKEIIFKCAKDFGFKIKENASIFKSVLQKKFRWIDFKAIFFIRGDYGIKDNIYFETDQGKKIIYFFIYQVSYSEKRLEKIASYIMKKKLVNLFKGLDENYLATVLKEASEIYIFEELKAHLKKIPIFRVIFADDGSFTIEEEGTV